MDMAKIVVETAINNMLQVEKHFSICTVDKAMRLLDIHAGNSKEYQALSLLHCMDYAIMPPAVREAIPGALSSLLDSEAHNLSFTFKKAPTRPVERVYEAPKGEATPRGLLRLLGR